MRMRWTELVLFCLAACHSSDEAPARKIVPVVEPDDAAPAPVDAARDAGPEVTLREIDGGAARRARSGGVLLCDTHSVWTPPGDFAVATSGTAVFARRGDELVGVAYPPHGDASYALAVGQFVEGTLVWDAPAPRRIDDWHAEAIAHARGNGHVAAARTLYAGVDPKTGKGRAGRDSSHAQDDVVWFVVALTASRADELLEDARKSERMLTDHACECGYDCAKR